MKKWIILIIGIFCIAAAAIFVKKANIAAEASAFYRFFFALILVSIFFVFRNNKKENFVNIILCVAGGFIFGLEQAFWNESVMLSGATVPTILVNLSSVWVGVIGGTLLNEKTGIFHWVGNIIALSGLVLVIGIGQITSLKIDQGVIYSILASFLFALYLLMVKSLRLTMNTISVLFYSLVGSLLSILILCIVRQTNLVGFTKQTWGFLICLAAITQVGGYLSINYALGHIESSKVSLFILLQPILTGIFAYIFINERLDINQLAGGAIVISGLTMSFIKQPKNLG